MKFTSITFAASLGYQVSAHGIVTKIVAGTKTYQGYNPNFQYMPTPPAVIAWSAPMTQDRGPVAGNQYQNPNIICQRGATNGKMAAEIAAGDMVSLQWEKWPDSHKGPMLDFLAPCNGDCSAVDKTQLKFFKIDGVGMTDPNGMPPKFADDVMVKNNNTWTVKIPNTIKAGNYVLRHETIALHQAQGVGGAQNYPQCVNLMVTGGGSDAPDGVLGTQLYQANDMGLVFNIYKKFTSASEYTVPGPPLYSGGSSPEDAIKINSASIVAGAAPTSAPGSNGQNNNGQNKNGQKNGQY